MLVGLTFVAAFGLLATGCTERAPQVLYVNFNQAVDRATVCEARVNAEATRPIGWMDLAITNKYLLFPTVSNQMKESAQIFSQSVAELRGENNVVQITGATIDYDVPPDLAGDLAAQGLALPQGQFVFTSGSIDPEDQGVFVLEAVPALVGEVLRLSDLLSARYATTQILVRVVVEGVLADGQVVKSNEFVYPLNVCRGCLVYFPVPECTAPATEDLVVPCFPGQDEGVDCRVCYQLATTNKEAALCLPPVKK
jgi:hypothetical protein